MELAELIDDSPYYLHRTNGSYPMIPAKSKQGSPKLADIEEIDIYRTC